MLPNELNIQLDGLILFREGEDTQSTERLPDESSRRRADDDDPN